MIQKETYTVEEIQEFLEKQREQENNANSNQATVINPGKSTMRNESLGLEAAKDGWGTSRWDKGEYYPGKDIETSREIERDAYIQNTAIWISISITVAIIAYYVTKAIIKNAKKPKKKEESNIEEALLYVKFRNQSDNTESTDSDRQNSQVS